jgi:hypothetical protein
MYDDSSDHMKPNGRTHNRRNGTALQNEVADVVAKHQGLHRVHKERTSGSSASPNRLTRANRSGLLGQRSGELTEDASNRQVLEQRGASPVRGASAGSSPHRANGVPLYLLPTCECVPDVRLFQTLYVLVRPVHVPLVPFFVCADVQDTAPRHSAPCLLLVDTDS